MIIKVEVLAETELRGGVFRFFMKPQLLSWNVRGLNEGDKCLRVRNLLRDGRQILVVFRKLYWSMSCSVCSLPTCGLVLFSFMRGFWWDFVHVG
jgi:hypothetical protein